MMGKLFALYPPAPGEDLEFKLAAYIEETRRVSPNVLSHALRRVVDAQAKPWLPSVYQILEAAREIEEERRVKQRYALPEPKPTALERAAAAAKIGELADRLEGQMRTRKIERARAAQ